MAQAAQPQVRNEPQRPNLKRAILLLIVIMIALFSFVPILYDLRYNRDHSKL
jgi:hypothetical protein